MNQVNNNLLQIPQVILLTNGPLFKSTINFLIKKIICLSPHDYQQSGCVNCQKFDNNNYFDLNWVLLNEDNYLKKQDVINIIDNLLITSLENNSPKISVIEQIEYSTLQASNSFLKFLENVNQNTYLIFTTNNLDKVLPTIKSRSQILNLPIDNSQEKHKEVIIDEVTQLKLEIAKTFNYDSQDINNDDFEIILNLVMQFITNDNNNQFDNNFLLIKELSSLKQKSILFFRILFLLSENKILNLKSTINDNLVFKKLLSDWTNNNQIFLTNILETSTLLASQFSNKINLNLLFNNFFITIYKDE